LYPVPDVESTEVRQLSDRYTRLSDRFRSVWTFYQFLGGVFKHRGDGDMPVHRDFQGLYRRLQELVPQLPAGASPPLERELDRVESELDEIHHELAELEQQFSPSVLRRFFDHLKRQDEKILYALAKFYLRSNSGQEDRFDKLDILLTRLAEVPIDDERIAVRSTAELRPAFQRLASYGAVTGLPREERHALVKAVRELRDEMSRIDDFNTLLESDVHGRFRTLKRQLGASVLDPDLLIEIVATNIEAANRFRTLYREEEARILEDTNKIFEIERYLERNPGLASEQLRRELDHFRRSRERFDSGRRDDNVKRDDVAELRRAMRSVLELFDPRGRGAHSRNDSPGLELELDDSDARADAAAGGEGPEPFELAETLDAEDPGRESTSLAELLPPDPLLNEPLHKIMFALELVEWDRPPEQLATAKELHGLRLEPWEVDAYRRLVERSLPEGSLEHLRAAFYLTSAALRLRMEEERQEIERALRADRQERVEELLESSAQSLERAREVERRFLWFAEDLLYRGVTDQLEHVYRSRFRFLFAYSELWLAHQANGGITPL